MVAVSSLNKDPLKFADEGRFYATQLINHNLIVGVEL